MESNELSKLSALSHEHRLALFRLLVRRFPDDVRAGDLAEALGYKPNTTSAYLSILRDAGLITLRRAGTSLFYRANLDGARDLVQYLFSECCRDRLTLTLPGDPCHLLNSKCPAQQKQHVLFLCTGNSARSVIAEALLRDTAGEIFHAFSAGTTPARAPHPMALEVLTAKGHDVSGLTSKDLSLFRRPDAPHMQMVITLCDRAAHEECPAWAGHPLNTHWGLPDPARIEGSLETRRRGFERVYDLLERKIDALAGINLQIGSRSELQKALDDIGGRVTKESFQ